MKKALAAGAIAALALPAAAQAHVTLQPKTAQAGSFTVESVRVPTERDDASTQKVEVQLPHGFPSVSYQPVPGWKVTLAKEKLAKPIQTDDGPVTEEVRRVTFTATDKAAQIAPGQFRDFPLSVQIPDKAPTTLTFKALQTYSDGQVVRWIGLEGSDHPAPTVAVQAASAQTGAPLPVDTGSTAEDDDDDGGNGVALGLAIAALALAVVALATARRRSA
jgi:uncharacterized protein